MLYTRIIYVRYVDGIKLNNNTMLLESDETNSVGLQRPVWGPTISEIVSGVSSNLNNSSHARKRRKGRG